MEHKRALGVSLEMLILLTALAVGYVCFAQCDIHGLVKSDAVSPLRSELSLPAHTPEAVNIVARIYEEGLLSRWRDISREE